MRKLFVVVLLSAFVLTPVYVSAQANVKALEHANDKAIFNRVGDWFATAGKSDEEKVKIKAERQAKRAAKRAEREAKKAKKKAMEKKGEMQKKMKGSKGSDHKGSK